MRRFRFVLSFMIMSLLFTAKNSVYALTIDQLLSQNNIDLNCPTGYSEDSTRILTGSGPYEVSLICARTDISNFNSSVKKIVENQLPRDMDPNDYLSNGVYNIPKYKNNPPEPYTHHPDPNDPTIIKNRWSYLLALPNGVITAGDLIAIRNLGVDRVDTTSNQDEYIADMAGRLGQRVGLYYDANNNALTAGGYQEYWDNTIHPDPYCEPDFIKGSFIATTEASWNALPGDSLITRNRNLSAIGLFDGAGLTFTHTGMATGPYGVRHLTTYSDFFSSADEIDSSDPAKVHIKPQYLSYSSPGTITENLDGSFCKTDPPDNVPVCMTLDPVTGKAYHRREWDSSPDSDLNTFVLTTSNANTRANLQSALNTALTTEEYYSVYSFANGIYNQNPKHRECATFVRDALISSFGSTTFDSYITTPPLLVDLQTLFNFYDPNVTSLNLAHWQIPYATDYKSFWYSAENRAKGAKGLYEAIFATSADQVHQGLTDTMDLNFSIFSTFFQWFLKGILNGDEKHIRQNIATQIVNCFSFNDCGNYQNPPATTPDSDNVFSYNNLAPFWPEDSFVSSSGLTSAVVPGTRPIEEGWTFSPDDILNFTAYDRMERINKIPSQTITSCAEYSKRESA